MIAEACDTHIHVVGDPGGLLQDRTYTPGPAPMAALEAVAAPLGIGRFVVVQPSFYGTDNSLLLQTLDDLNGRGRGVVVIDPATITSDALADMDRRGVRGLRINLYSTLGAKSPRQLDHTFQAMAAIAERMRWHVEVLAALPLLAQHAPLLAGAPCPVVIDHYALYTGHTPQSAEARTLLNLVATRHVWLKLSAPYRAEADPLATRPDPAWLTAFLRAAPARCVWGSDWPHTPPHAGQTGDAIPLPYRTLDYADVVHGFRSAVADPAVARAVMVTNAARLYGF